MDLSDRNYLYKFISSVHKVHLGVADKMLINLMMREHNPSTIDDIGGLIPSHLIQFGYENESRHLREKDRRHSIWLKEFAEYIERRYQPHNL